MKELSERLCTFLDGFEGRLCPFLPETMGEGTPACGVFLKGDVEVKTYVDGSAIRTVPVEVRVRIGGVSAREKLDVHGMFATLGDYVKGARRVGGPILSVEPLGGSEKVASHLNGEEEYRMKLAVRVKV